VVKDGSMPDEVEIVEGPLWQLRFEPQ
jgi:hypothetical protein